VKASATNNSDSNIDDYSVSEFDATLAEKIYFDATDTIRHYDKERSTSSRVLFTALALIYSLAGAAMQTNSDAWFVISLGLFAIILSIIGYLINLKFAYLINLQRSRARVSISVVTKNRGPLKSTDINQIAKSELKINFISNLSMASLWNFIFLLFAVYGVFFEINYAISNLVLVS